MLRSLVGSEMCIRDRTGSPLRTDRRDRRRSPIRSMDSRLGSPRALHLPCLLYTSDAADDPLCVDLGCRRLIKQKKKKKTQNRRKTKRNNTQ